MEKKIVVTRLYQAPVDLVWKTWTDPSLIKQWWGPDKFICDHANIDFREGATSHVSMRAPKEFGGGEWFNIWRYRRIIAMERIEFDQSFSDKKGRKISPIEAGMPADFPDVVFTIVTFKDLGNSTTEMTVTEHGDMGQMERNARLGLEQCLNKIQTLLNS